MAQARVSLQTQVSDTLTTTGPLSFNICQLVVQGCTWSPSTVEQFFQSCLQPWTPTIIILVRSLSAPGNVSTNHFVCKQLLLVLLVMPNSTSSATLVLCLLFHQIKESTIGRYLIPLIVIKHIRKSKGAESETRHGSKDISQQLEPNDNSLDHTGCEQCICSCCFLK